MIELDGVNNYSYDDIEQLIKATHPQPSNPAETFTYDLVGNRTSSSVSSNYAYNSANRLLEDDQFTYDYDPNGNMTRKTEKSTGKITEYTFDSENKLIRIDFSDGKFSIYRYDVSGRRIQKNVNGAITNYIYDNEDILAECDEAGQILARYTHGPDIDEPIIMNTGGQDYFYHADGLGSITAITDASGNIAQAYTYNAFGSIVNKSGSIANHYTYTSREIDQESGLYYNRARYYDSNLGRFISEDPLFSYKNYPQALNVYIYVVNNPVYFIDPLGLKHCRSFGSYFAECMDLFGLPSPKSAFGTYTTATSTVSAIAGFVAKFGTKVTVGELISAGLLSEKLMVVAILGTSFYTGAFLGCLLTALDDLNSCDQMCIDIRIGKDPIVSSCGTYPPWSRVYLGRRYSDR